MAVKIPYSSDEIIEMPKTKDFAIIQLKKEQIIGHILIARSQIDTDIKYEGGLFYLIHSDKQDIIQKQIIMIAHQTPGHRASFDKQTQYLIKKCLHINNAVKKIKMYTAQCCICRCLHAQTSGKKYFLSYMPESGPSMELFKQINNGGSKKFIIDQAGPFLYRINLDKKT